MTNQK